MKILILKLLVLGVVWNILLKKKKKKECWCLISIQDGRVNLEPGGKTVSAGSAYQSIPLSGTHYFDKDVSKAIVKSKVLHNP